MMRKTIPAHIESSQNNLLTQINPLHYDLMPVVNAQQVNQLVDPMVKAQKNIQDQNED